MINVAAIRMQQFGVQSPTSFPLTASDIDKLLSGFEVLSYGDGASAGFSALAASRSAPVAITAAALEGELGLSRTAHRVEPDKAYQRQIIRKVKIDELVQHFMIEVPTGRAILLVSIPARWIISCDEKLTFQPGRRAIRASASSRFPSARASLRAISTASISLLALHADIDRFQGEDFAVPAIIFDRLPEDHVVQMFVTINAKHTRLNASHLVSLSGRQRHRDEAASPPVTTSCARAQRPRG